MANTALQAESVLANHASDTIAVLFSLWIKSVQAYAAHPGDGDNPEWCKLLDHSDAVMKRLMQIPAMTVDDMAIKSYLAVRYELGATTAEFEINFDNGIMTDAAPHRALVADAMRLSPLLRAVVTTGGTGNA